MFRCTSGLLDGFLHFVGSWWLQNVGTRLHSVMIQKMIVISNWHHTLVFSRWWAKSAAAFLCPFAGIINWNSRTSDFSIFFYMMSTVLHCVNITKAYGVLTASCLMDTWYLSREVKLAIRLFHILRHGSSICGLWPAEMGFRFSAAIWKKDRWKKYHIVMITKHATV
jgi:hypothetical protein